MALPGKDGPPPTQGATRQEILNEVKILALVDHPNCLTLKARAATGVCAPSPRWRLRRHTNGPALTRSNPQEWFSEGGKALILTEYVRGGEVLLVRAAPRAKPGARRSAPPVSVS